MTLSPMNNTNEKPDGFTQAWDELPTLLFIPLTRGKFAVIDRDSWVQVGYQSWHAEPSNNGRVWYARGNDGKRMHRVVLPDATTLDIDHWNRIGTDNRRRNLRPATRSQNMMNVSARNPTGFKGVSRTGRRRGFRALISIGNHTYKGLGTYATAEDAAVAYDLASMTLHGEFAFLNFEHRRSEYEESAASGKPIPLARLHPHVWVSRRERVTT
jgi:hypothetical protein